MYSLVRSFGLFGLNAFAVDVEIEASKGTPLFEIVGLGDVVVKESRERIKSALRQCDIAFPLCRVMVNLAPADTKKTGSMHDLAITVALMKITGNIVDDISNHAFIGEVSLNGRVRAVDGVLPMVILAQKMGVKNIFVPYDNRLEASVVDGINVFAVKNIQSVINHFNKKEIIIPENKYEFKHKDVDYKLDFCDVKGQQNAKKALEIAACGGHNALLIGTPGSGKSMLAKRMPSILPEMTFKEAIETTNIHSIAGKLKKDNPLVSKRPFRSPHHTISPAGLVGGGSIPKPGEISLAHNGLLFLDEFAEFSRQSVEILRQPLEEQKVAISRVAGSVEYPCSFMIIAAMNPCPCGYYGHPTRKCICSKNKVEKYLSKVSGPMIDRFDIHVELAPVEFGDISSTQKSETSKVIRERVQKVRDIQNQRFKGTAITCNARITSDILHEVCILEKSALIFIKNVFEKMGLSARAYDRILKVSRTIADMDNSEIILKRHIAQAVQYRSLDRKYWG